MKTLVDVNWFGREARVNIDVMDYAGGEPGDFAAIGCTHHLTLRTAEARREFAALLREAADKLEAK